jgi:hypothetical protein
VGGKGRRSRDTVVCASFVPSIVTPFVRSRSTPFFLLHCIPPSSLLLTLGMAFERPAAKVSLSHISVIFFTQRTMHHISLVRQATASGSMTELQGLLELPRNHPNQTRRSVIRLW